MLDKKRSFEEYQHGNVPEADYDFFSEEEDPDARASGEDHSLQIHDDMAATMLSNCGIESPFRTAFANMKIEEVQEMFYKEPDDYRSAAMLQYLYKTGANSFKSVHIDDIGQWSKGSRGSSNARASGEQSELVHNQHARKNQQASPPSPTPPARWVTWE